MRATKSQQSDLDLGLGIRRLDADDDAHPVTACGVCGMQTDTPAGERTEYPVMAREGVISAITGSDYRPISLGICATCADRHRVASEVMAAHPRVRTSIGSDSIGDHRLACSLDALAVLEQPAPPELPVNDRQLRALMSRLSSIGMAMRWAARFSPMMRVGAVTRSCATAPFAHVDTVLIGEARLAWAAWQADRLEMPTTVPAPGPLGGCVSCGLDHLVVPRYAKERAWLMLSPQTVAVATGTGRQVEGGLCPRCSTWFHLEGSLGPSFLDRAVLDHVDPQREVLGKRPDLPNLTGAGMKLWARTGNPPSPDRFAWLDAAATLADLRGGGWTA